MRGGNPFLTATALNAAFDRIRNDRYENPELHEELILAWEWELSLPEPERELWSELHPYLDWLRDNPPPEPRMRFHVSCLLGEAPAEPPSPELLRGIFGMPEEDAHAILALRPRVPHLRATVPLLIVPPPPLPSFARLHVSPHWRHPFSVVTSQGQCHLFCDGVGPQDVFNAARLAHEVAHVVHLRTLLREGRSLFGVLPWEREKAATHAELAFLRGHPPELVREWAVRAIADTLFPVDAAALPGSPLHHPAARFVYAAAALDALRATPEHGRLVQDLTGWAS